MRNVRRMAEHGELCVKLGQLSHPTSGTPLFRSFRELSCFAAMLGYEQGRQRDLTGALELFVDGRVFERSETAVDIGYLVTLASTMKPEVLLDTAEADETMAATFEKLAAGGLDILAEWIAAEPSDPNGDKAVLTALSKGGYLNRSASAEDALADVTF